MDREMKRESCPYGLVFVFCGIEMANGEKFPQEDTQGERACQVIVPLYQGRNNVLVYFSKTKDTTA